MSPTAASFNHPALIGVAITMLLILGAWALLDYMLGTADKRESEDLSRQIDEAYKKMGKVRP